MIDQQHDEAVRGFLERLQGYAWGMKLLGSDTHRDSGEAGTVAGLFSEALRHNVFDLIELALVLNTAEPAAVFREASELREACGRLIVERVLARIKSVVEHVRSMDEPWTHLCDVRGDFRTAAARLSVAVSLGDAGAKNKIMEIHRSRLSIEAQLLMAHGVDRANRALESFSRAPKAAEATSGLSPLAETRASET